MCFSPIWSKQPPPSTSFSFNPCNPASRCLCNAPPASQSSPHASTQPSLRSTSAAAAGCRRSGRVTLRLGSKRDSLQEVKLLLSSTRQSPATAALVSARDQPLFCPATASRPPLFFPNPATTQQRFLKRPQKPAPSSVFNPLRTLYECRQSCTEPLPHILPFPAAIRHPQLQQQQLQQQAAAATAAAAADCSSNSNLCSRQQTAAAQLQAAQLHQAAAAATGSSCRQQQPQQLRTAAPAAPAAAGSESSCRQQTSRQQPT